MRWNLRLAAANRGIWKASDLQRLLAEHGLVISAGKMSGLWSGQPELAQARPTWTCICAVLDCQVGELLIPEPDTVPRPGYGTRAGSTDAAAAARPDDQPPRVVPRRRDGRSLPPA